MRCQGTFEAPGSLARSNLRLASWVGTLPPSQHQTDYRRKSDGIQLHVALLLALQLQAERCPCVEEQLRAVE